MKIVTLPDISSGSDSFFVGSKVTWVEKLQSKKTNQVGTNLKMGINQIQSHNVPFVREEAAKGRHSIIFFSTVCSKKERQHL